ncbi:MAG TPA: VOC family protein [Dongiaceae bacterium]|nr:VOC family protein [Dongiaceae bacterium]
MNLGGRALPGLTGIDHSLLGVRDLEEARSRFTGLGFTLTPRGRHIGWGTANYCIMFEAGYVELLGIVDPAQFTNNLDKFLAQREGLLGLAFGSDDAAALGQALAAAGFHPEGPKALKRALELPEGEVLPAFELLFLPPEELPDLRAFFCRHLSPEIVRRPAWLGHENGARRLAGLTIASDRPGDLAEAYGRLFGTAALRQVEGGIEIEAGSGRLSFLTPPALQACIRPLELPDYPRPRMAVQTIAVEDLDRLDETLRRRGHAPVAAGGRYLLPPEAANGCLLEFIADA